MVDKNKKSPDKDQLLPDPAKLKESLNRVLDRASEREKLFGQFVEIQPDFSRPIHRPRK